MHKRKVVFYILLLMNVFYSAHAQPGCPNINAGADVTVNCNNACVQLSANYLRTGATTSYQVSSIPYNPPYPYNQGTNIIMNVDDTWSSLLTLPFDFCFFGQSYNKITVGSNGVISFNQAYAGGFCPYWFEVTSPDPTLPLNSILGPYHDMDPTHYWLQSNGTIKYAILGTAPCRTFVLSYDQVPLYQCGTPRATHQIVIYETTNVIEVYIQEKGVCSGWNGGRGIIGIQNHNGTQGYAPPNRNGTLWTANNEAWRFTPNGASNVNIQWLQGTTVIGTGDTITVCPSITTNYTARATYYNCNGNTVVENDVVAVNFQNNLNPILTPVNPIICRDSLLNLSITGGSSYQWSHGLGSDSVVTVSPATSTTYSVTVTKGACTAVRNVLVTVNPIPTVNVSNSMPTICVGQSSNLTATGASSYVWSPSTSLNTSTGSLVVASPSTPTTYTVLGTANGCSSSATTTVQVNPIPIIEVNPSLSSICPGETVTLVASGATAYSWSPNSGLSATTGASINASPLQSINYTVTGTQNGCIGTSIVSVNVKPKPIMSVSPASSDICLGDSVLVTVGTADTFQWLPTTGLNFVANNQAFASPTQNTSYTVVGITDACQDSVSFLVNVISNPSITINPASAEICPGESVTLNAIGGIHYTWSPTAGLSTSTSASVIASPTQTTTYSVVGTTSGCSGMANVQVVVKQKPVLTFSPTTANICSGDSVSLNVSGADSFHWNPNSGLNVNNSANVTANPITSTSYNVIGTLNGCTDSAVVLVAVNPLPIIQISSSITEGCQPLLLNFSANSNPAAQQYLWYFGNGQSSLLPNPTTGYVNAGQYDVSLEVVDVNSCKNSIVMPQMITVHPKPEIDFSVTPDIGMQQAISSFQSSYTQSPATWFWDFGEGNTKVVTTSLTTHTFEYGGEFVVTHMVETKFGCRDTVQKTYVVDLEIVVPNVFTPNSDGNNDYFVIKGIEYMPNCHLKIYNRWGRVVYENTEYKNDWDGSGVAEGTYYFILKLPVKDFEPVYGSVSVFR